MSARIVLVRHPEVARAWAGRCYGQSDMGWSRAGAAAASLLAERLAAFRPDAIVHSDLRRTRRLAERLGARLGIAATADPRWRERHFGRWEGRPWDAIWRETGDEMDRMVTESARYRPGGGETTAELSARALSAWGDLPENGTTIVIAHGGPIATIRAALENASADRLAALVPGLGEVITVTRGTPKADAR